MNSKFWPINCVIHTYAALVQFQFQLQHITLILLLSVLVTIWLIRTVCKVYQNAFCMCFIGFPDGESERDLEKYMNICVDVKFLVMLWYWKLWCLLRELKQFSSCILVNFYCSDELERFIIIKKCLEKFGHDSIFMTKVSFYSINWLLNEKVNGPFAVKCPLYD